MQGPEFLGPSCRDDAQRFRFLSGLDEANVSISHTVNQYVNRAYSKVTKSALSRDPLHPSNNGRCSWSLLNKIGKYHVIVKTTVSTYVKAGGLGSHLSHENVVFSQDTQRILRT